MSLQKRHFPIYLKQSVGATDCFKWTATKYGKEFILLYNDGILETADVISSFVYRRGLLNYEWSYSTAVGLFNSVINFILIVGFNRLSRTLSETSLW